jgi:hypothetical protein
MTPDPGAVVVERVVLPHLDQIGVEAGALDVSPVQDALGTSSTQSLRTATSTATPRDERRLTP